MNTRISPSLLLVLCALLGLGLFQNHSLPVYAQQAGKDDLFAVTAPAQAVGTNILYVVDPTTRRLAIYEHSAGNGTLRLQCVRNMDWDLQVPEEFPPAKVGKQSPPVKKMKAFVK